MEWKEVTLGDFMQCNPKRTIKKGQKARKITMDLLIPHSKTIRNWNYEPYSGGAKFQNGDTIMARITPCLENGKHAFVSILNKGEIAYGSTEYFVFCGKEDVSDNDFVYYLTKTPLFRDTAIKSMVGSSGRQRAQMDVLENLKMLVPKDISDQRRIASILSSLDRKIELNNKINADLEEMAQAIFKNWFVDFEPFKDGKFVDSELGMIPEGWKVGRLTDVIKLMPGGTPKTSEPLYWDNGTIPFFSPKDVNGVYCFATEKHITETGLNKCSSNLYPKDTIFITCRGTVGKVCLAACDMAMNQSNYAIKAIDGYSQYYVFFLVKSVVERLIKKSNGAVFSAITSKDFDEEILIPSQKAVEDFTNMIDGFFRRIFTIGTENSRLSALRDTLLPRLMSGELEVPE